MSHKANQHQQTHDRILESAGRIFRESGIARAGIGRIMKSIGMTVGGFYNHFDSKSDLLREVVDNTVSTPVEGEHPEQSTAVHQPDAVLEMYLSEFHRDNPGVGCIVPCLSAEIARADNEVRQAYTVFVERILGKMAKEMPAGGGLTKRQRAIGVMAMAAGGLLLSRAVNDPDVSVEVLEASRKAAEVISS